ncbi:hypothetical protein Nepgr_008447 [Nepenthes gracilis]|uniref:Lethal giant larvae (Lgl)-like C-terminal domain-containing protein n=1 Tax=Nepenthes gracilis TaxID=150966 RepID=A0AAD3S8X6_NEPGR|nr:hypothetical protein Nepgr_008447 [Nepenthes gracilis]
MFVKKLVEKATKKLQVGGTLECLKLEDVDPHVAFHYGIPLGSSMFAYDSIQKILAISTKYGRIKMLGKDNTQALLESNEMMASKFLQFIDNQGLLLHVTVKNQIEVWDIDRKLLHFVHDFDEEITSFTVMQQCFFIYVGDSLGNITVLKLDQVNWHIQKMNYRIPYLALHGNSDEVVADNAVMAILPQPTAESKRVLLIYCDGSIILWAIQESKAIFTTGGTVPLLCHEKKKATSACWACPFGSRVVVGYNSGEIFIYNIPSSELISDLTSRDTCITQNAPICKLNLAYKSEKNPIASLKCVYAEGKETRLYVMGASDASSTNLVQVILLNEHIESRTTKLAIQLTEPCLDMEITSGSNEQSKHKPGFLLLMGKSGHIYVYDDHLIEKYLLQCHSRSPPSIPREVKMKLTFLDSCITSAKFITNNSPWFSSADEDYALVAKRIPSLLPSEAKQFDTTGFSGFSKIKNLYITGHSDGAINFWDFTGPLFLPLLSIKQQGEDDSSSSGVAVTTMFFDCDLRLLVSGDQSGMVRIYKFKPEPFASENNFFQLQGSSKKGSHRAIHSVKLIKVCGTVLSINMGCSSRHLAVGSEQGYISLIDIEGATLVYQKHIASELSAGVISLQFEICSFHGFEKNVLVVATRDSSVLAFDSDTGDTLSSSMIHPKKPSRALFMQILDGRDRQSKGSDIPGSPDSSKAVSAEDGTPKQLSVLLCSEKAVYVYSLTHVVQGVKKVCYKKKFGSSSCCWASTFCCPSGAGLILLFSCGKIEIRSLPELSLVKETTFRSIICSSSKPNSYSDSTVISSSDAELIVVRSDQEISVVSMLSQKEKYRHLDSFSKVYDKDLMASTEQNASPSAIQKEKKKGIFGSVIKDLKGSKTSHAAEAGAEDVSASFEELSTIFSISNYPADAESMDNNPAVVKDDVDLDIDDIDLEDPEGKPKGHSVMASLNKKKLASKFLSFKGKLKQIKVKNEKTPVQEEPQDEKVSAVDQIKRKYGFPSSSESSYAKMAESKLAENLKKLQGINVRSTEMQDTARSFSSMAKDMLRNFERDKQNP